MLYYIRDEEESLIGFKYNDNLYYYLKSMQEDIIGLTYNNFNKAKCPSKRPVDILNVLGTFYENNNLLKSYEWDIRYSQFIFHN